jgi:hypothetical protein
MHDFKYKLINIFMLKWILINVLLVIKAYFEEEKSIYISKNIFD